MTVFEGPDFSDFGCSPNEAFDTSLTTGWGSVESDDDGTPDNVFDPKSITVRLPQPVDITHFQVDPDATCGDDPSSAVADFKIETSTGRHDVAHGGLGRPSTSSTAAPQRGGPDRVRHGRELRAVHHPQQPDAGLRDHLSGQSRFSGCVFTDLTELAVLGSPGRLTDRPADDDGPGHAARASSAVTVCR